MALIDLFVGWQRKERSERTKIALILVQSPFFLLIIPLLFAGASLRLDARYDLQGLVPGPFNIALAVLCVPPGLLLLLWSVWSLYRSGKGTPAPMIPTQELVVTGPYAFSRNPMILGVALYQVGIGFILDSPSFLAIVAVFISFALIYVKIVEENELARRFGRSYEDYKRSTPFFIPKLWPK